MKKIVPNVMVNMPTNSVEVEEHPLRQAKIREKTTNFDSLLTTYLGQSRVALESTDEVLEDLQKEKAKTRTDWLEFAIPPAMPTPFFLQSTAKPEEEDLAIQVSDAMGTLEIKELPQIQLIVPEIKLSGKEELIGELTGQKLEEFDVKPPTQMDFEEMVSQDPKHVETSASRVSEMDAPIVEGARPLELQVQEPSPEASWPWETPVSQPNLQVQPSIRTQGKMAYKPITQSEVSREETPSSELLKAEFAGFPREDAMSELVKAEAFVQRMHESNPELTFGASPESPESPESPLGSQTEAALVVESVVVKVPEEQVEKPIKLDSTEPTLEQGSGVQNSHIEERKVERTKTPVSAVPNNNRERDLRTLTPHASGAELKIQEPGAKLPELEAKSGAALDFEDRETVIPRLTQNIQSLVREERSEVRIQLKPDHLGELKIKLSMERGIMMAEFIVENEAVREVIASQLPQLHTALQDQGAQVAEMTVNIGFGNKGQEEEPPARQRQYQGQDRGHVQGATTQASKTAYLGRTLWNQVDLKV